ncbi:ECF RNA polymerase sigma factor SigW [Roseomonas sp. TAS13]|uniref:sigma-70 family RNA polymerase sigma factor n=1 Tax=Roseomonas sp. TAS13 TaxID=1926319 RepID=UPI0009625A34|nr:sigma-70 family RNA polymerase sigma factor [Roseomonas sp. TAS13]USQ74202.1 sigma-70 family RNA polymerase sigma factor [Roseomonas mucosa]GAV34585.1 ECF RNA polymerase sigma factor SigW [Roseomonas sp. TAS13]
MSLFSNCIRESRTKPPSLDRNRPAASDETLMAWAAVGDRLAFEEVVLRHLARVHAIAGRILNDNDHAEDVAQETFLRAWQQAARFDANRGQLGAWLNRIVTNLAIDALRRHRPGEPLEDAMELPDPACDPEAALAVVQRDTRLAAAIAELPGRQRAAIALVYDQGFAGAEAAEMLGVSIRALEGLLRRTRHLLNARLRGVKP